MLPSAVVTLLSVLPLGSLVALVFWFVYAAQFARDGPNQMEDGTRNDDKAFFAFQAIVASAGVYYLLHHHSTLLMQM